MSWCWSPVVTLWSIVTIREYDSGHHSTQVKPKPICKISTSLAIYRVESSATLTLLHDVPLSAAAFTTTWRHMNRSVHILVRPPLPNQHSESYIARSASSKLRPPKISPQRCCRLNSLFSRFHSQAPRVQTIQRPAAQRSSASRERPYGVLVPPTSRAPSKKADLGTWELSHTRALRVVCLERLRASKEIFPCMTTP